VSVPQGHRPRREARVKQPGVTGIRTWGAHEPVAVNEEARDGGLPENSVRPRVRPLSARLLLTLKVGPWGDLRSPACRIDS
jgi:hypothetical protein